MGHLGQLSPEHKRLLKRLNAASLGLPEPKDGYARTGWQEILEILYSEEDAKLAARIPVLPTSLEGMARQLGVSVDELKPKLDALCDKGVVVDLVHPDTGDVRYMLSPPVIGFFEFFMMRSRDHVPKKRMAEAMDAYLHGDRTFMQEAFGGETVIGRALVHESVLEDEAPQVLDWERASSIIKEATQVSVGICYCRHKAHHLDKACDAPLEACMALNAAADFVGRRHFGRVLDKTEALDILARSREQGLVQTCDNVQNRPLFICNCCGCCCDQLQAINRFSIPAVAPSSFQPVCNEDACNGCSKCARVCPIGAIRMVPMPVRPESRRKTGLVAQVDMDKCIGCGVCAGACTKDSLRMEARPLKRPIPLNTLDRSLRMAMERGHLGALLYELASQHRLGFLGKVVEALVNLPPAQKVLASKQVSSRFIRAVLAVIKDPTGG